MEWIDTHAHIYLDEMQKPISDIVRLAQEKGVAGICMPSLNTDSYAGMMRAVRAHPLVCFPMIGLHPCYVTKNYTEELDALYDHLCHSKTSYIAIGEVGLDFYHSVDFAEEQRQAFARQLQWAKEKNLPLAIHSRNAEDEVWNIIRSQKDSFRGVFHCFSGSVELAEALVQYGFYIGIGGAFTYKKNEYIRSVVKRIGLPHIILETDAPYLSPEPHRGKVNLPSHIPLIGQSIANYLGASIEEVADTTTANAKALFGIA